MINRLFKVLTYPFIIILIWYISIAIMIISFLILGIRYILFNKSFYSEIEYIFELPFNLMDKLINKGK